MNINTSTRGDTRVLAGAGYVGVLMGVGLAAAYAAGAYAPQTAPTPRSGAPNLAAHAALSDAALQQVRGPIDPSALAIAQRFDARAVSLASAQAQQKNAAFAAGLQRSDDAPPAPTVDSLMLRPALGTGYIRAGLRLAGGPLDGARDLECLTQAVYYEARGESAAGQQAVAQVILNRVRHPSFPKTVCAVVYQGAWTGHGCQFSFACDGSMHAAREPLAWRRAQGVAARALGGFVMNTVGGSTYFHAISVGPSWSQDFVRVAQVGLHIFYRMGHGGAAARESADGTMVAEAAKPAQSPVHSVLASLAPAAPEPAKSEPVSAESARVKETNPTPAPAADVTQPPPATETARTPA